MTSYAFIRTQPHTRRAFHPSFLFFFFFISSFTSFCFFAFYFHFFHAINLFIYSSFVLPTKFNCFGCALFNRLHTLNHLKKISSLRSLLSLSPSHTVAFTKKQKKKKQTKFKSNRSNCHPLMPLLNVIIVWTSYKRTKNFVKDFFSKLDSQTKAIKPNKQHNISFISFFYINFMIEYFIIFIQLHYAKVSFSQLTAFAIFLFFDDVISR